MQNFASRSRNIISPDSCLKFCSLFYQKYPVFIHVYWTTLVFKHIQLLLSIFLLYEILMKIIIWNGLSWLKNKFHLGLHCDLGVSPSFLPCMMVSFGSAPFWSRSQTRDGSELYREARYRQFQPKLSRALRTASTPKSSIAAFTAADSPIWHLINTNSCSSSVWRGNEKKVKRFLVACYGRLHLTMSVHPSVHPSVRPSIRPSVCWLVLHILDLLWLLSFDLTAPAQMV